MGGFDINYFKIFWLCCHHVSTTGLRRRASMEQKQSGDIPSFCNIPSFCYLPSEPHSELYSLAVPTSVLFKFLFFNIKSRYSQYNVTFKTLQCSQSKKFSENSCIYKISNIIQMMIFLLISADRHIRTINKC